ncbi:hypothetical protein [uncultured Cohaesibacter sp.]|uniref:hypothetical protein n=1 Tax=uncultured Cohaesibacter sp. TaxID=1002546 RepID=UPI0029C8ECA2|nr:hypothetical protein [uncultured Cohaesibacter sp.]
MKKILIVCILAACFIGGIILTYETPANSNQLNGIRMTSSEKQQAETKIESFLEANMAYFNPFQDQVRVDNCKITYRLNSTGSCDTSPTARFNEFQIDLKDVKQVRVFENSRLGTAATGSIRFEFTEEVQKKFDRAQALFDRYNQKNTGYTGSMWAQEAYSAEQSAVKGAGLNGMRSYSKTQNCSRSVQQFHLPKALGTISLSKVDRTAAYSLKNYHASCAGI